MLLEWLSCCFSGASSVARRLGWPNEQAAIEARRRRCAAAWAPHLDNCRRLILDAADRCGRRRLAVALGSGSLFDVPLTELAERFERVVLCDIHHPRRARRMARRHANVELDRRDLTGLAERAAEIARSGRPSELSVEVPDHFVAEDPDLVVSLNVLSQLPIGFWRGLSGIPGHGQEELERLGRSLIEAHLAWLARFSGVVCLITDRTWTKVDGGRTVSAEDALEGVVLPEPDRVWPWTIAPRPEESRSHDRINVVWGYVEYRLKRGA